MSYNVYLLVGHTSPNDREVWEKIDQLQENYYEDERDIAPALLALHATLTARYPCLSNLSLSGDHKGMESSPWANGPMLGNFKHEMGMLAMTFSQLDVVMPFVVSNANKHGITVADPQLDMVFRP